MSIYGRTFSLSLPVLILCAFLGLLAPLGYFAIKWTDKPFFGEEGPFWLFMMGLIPGLCVALLQFLLSWLEFSQISKFRQFRIKGVLDSRDFSEYYSTIIAAAQTKIDVEGVTASRFLRDFAEIESTRQTKRILIAALQNGVKVRLLLPEKGFLSGDDLAGYDSTANAADKLKEKFPTGIEVRYFNHRPSNSLVRVDDDIIVGPVFSRKESRHTPAIHTVVGGRYGKSYIDNFNDEWESARPRW